MWQVRDGEVEKLGVLFERHQRMLFNFFVRLTNDRELSEDLVQEVFFRMLKYRDTFQSGNPFRAWMFQVARNAHFDALRKSQREARLADSAPEGEMVCPEPAPDLRLEQRQEIGEILGCDAGTVKVRVHRALKELRDIFRELTGGERYEV